MPLGLRTASSKAGYKLVRCMRFQLPFRPCLDRRVLGYIFVQTKIVVLKREWIPSITWIESKYTPILSYPNEPLWGGAARRIMVGG
jgi:hypothetical protein